GVGSVFFSSRRRHTRFSRDWSSDVCSSDLAGAAGDGRVHDHLRRRHDDHVGQAATLQPAGHDTTVTDHVLSDHIVTDDTCDHTWPDPDHHPAHDHDDTATRHDDGADDNHNNAYDNNDGGDHDD